MRTNLVETGRNHGFSRSQFGPLPAMEPMNGCELIGTALAVDAMALGLPAREACHLAGFTLPAFARIRLRDPNVDRIYRAARMQPTRESALKAARAKLRRSTPPLKRKPRRFRRKWRGWEE